MFRCDCLEPVWPCRHHCFYCHRSFISDFDLEGHNNDGRCTSAAVACEKGKKISDTSTVKGSLNCVINREECRGEMKNGESSRTANSELNAKLIKFQNKGFDCPYDLEEICSKFVTNDSNQELIQEIGLIGSNGIPSFVSSLSPYLSESAVALISLQKDVGGPGNGQEAGDQLVSVGCNIHSGSADGLEVSSNNRPTLRCPERRNTRTSGIQSIVGSGPFCVVPQSSLRPVVGKVSEIFRRLKINLLDMEAALPEDAIRPSKAHLEKRWAWRAFVKSASTIYEMVQATIVFEDMIKSEYLKNEWWYWSSYSAAAKTSTVSSLSLRIYSLDAAILYEKMLPNSDTTDNVETSSVLDQKMLPVMDSTEKNKLSRKFYKKRKEPEG